MDSVVAIVVRCASVLDAADAVVPDPVAGVAFWPVLTSLLAAAGILLLAALCLVVLDIAVGTFVLRRKVLAFLGLPVLNVALYLAARAWLLPDSSPLAYGVVLVPLAFLYGLFGAAIVAGWQVLRAHLERAHARVEQRGRERAAWSPSDGLTCQVLGEARPDEPHWRAFWRGVMAPLDGFAYLCDNPRLWWCGVLPVLLNLLITVAVGVFLLVAAAGFIVYAHPRFSSVWVELLSGAIALLTVLATAFILWMLLKGILCGYYHAKLAREVEIHLGARPEDLMELSWKHEAVDAFREVGSLIVINAGLLFLHLVPGVGTVAAVVGTAYFNCLLLGGEYFDFPLALRARRRLEKKQFIHEHRYQTLGLGVCALGGTSVPILGAVLLVTSVAGAVLLHRRLAPDSAPPGGRPEATQAAVF